MRRPAIMLVAYFLFMGTVGSFSQDAPSKPITAKPSAPTNLKVLPSETSIGDVNQLMLRYSQSLGVTCAHCHEQDQETKQMNFASDANPVKTTARFMISMTSDINNKYLSQLGDRRYAQPITCGNCHQGQTTPPAFDK